MRSCRALVRAAAEVADELGVPIANRRIAISPLALVGSADERHDFPLIARSLDRAAHELGIDFHGGCTALIAGGLSKADEALIAALPEILATIERVCASAELASTRIGLNMDTVLLLVEAIARTAQLTADRDSLGCAKLVLFANAVEDNPFMAGTFHGVGQPQACINVGVSGPGVITLAVRERSDADLGEFAEVIKWTSFKVTRAGELVGRTVAERLGIPFGSVDLSLAPSPIPGDSVGEVLEAMGLERVCLPGSTATLAILTDAAKKGGAMASSRVGGLSGSFIPVSEDTTMARAAAEGVLCVEKLEALTAVCSVRLDMVAIPGSTPVTTIAGLIADELTIGMINHKTVGVWLRPASGRSSAACSVEHRSYRCARATSRPSSAGAGGCRVRSTACGTEATVAQPLRRRGRLRSTWTCDCRPTAAGTSMMATAHPQADSRMGTLRLRCRSLRPHMPPATVGDGGSGIRPPSQVHSRHNRVHTGAGVVC